MKLPIAALLATLAFISAATAKPPQTEEERAQAMRGVVWRDGQELSLPVSHGRLQAPAAYKQLLGPDAATLWEVLNGIAAPMGTEAALYDPVTHAVIFFQKLGDGYVKLDDWDELDADALLKGVTDNTEADNAKRQGSGIPPVHVVGWLERPQLDRAASTVRWSFETSESGRPAVNSIALVLARDGFEKIVWVGDRQYAMNNDFLRAAQANFDFVAGGRYVDHQSSDKVAEYGIATLVASVLGVKVAAKLGFLAIALAFLKKGFVLVLVPFAFMYRRIKGWFSRGKAPPSGS
ncbi:MAG TPA: DUF2167 domain-containing protein [Reyranella sp.]|nr:DUF2167 domain-containing protein [Reyranella sp.]